MGAVRNTAQVPLPGLTSIYFPLHSTLFQRRCFARLNIIRLHKTLGCVWSQQVCLSSGWWVSSEFIGDLVGITAFWILACWESFQSCECGEKPHSPLGRDVFVCEVEMNLCLCLSVRIRALPEPGTPFAALLRRGAHIRAATKHSFDFFSSTNQVYFSDQNCPLLV